MSLLIDQNQYLKKLEQESGLKNASIIEYKEKIRKLHKTLNECLSCLANIYLLSEPKKSDIEGIIEDLKENLEGDSKENCITLLYHKKGEVFDSKPNVDSYKVSTPNKCNEGCVEHTDKFGVSFKVESGGYDYTIQEIVAVYKYNPELEQCKYYHLDGTFGKSKQKGIYAVIDGSEYKLKKIIDYRCEKRDHDEEKFYPNFEDVTVDTVDKLFKESSMLESAITDNLLDKLKISFTSTEYKKVDFIKKILETNSRYTFHYHGGKKNANRMWCIDDHKCGNCN